MLQRFIDREHELKELKKAYKKDTPEFFIVYGRRRIGKSELVKKFVQERPHFYYLAKRQDLELEKERFRRELAQKFDIYLEEAETIEGTIKQFIEKADLKNKFILAIDEFPYWMEEDDRIISEFQHLWDEFLQNKNIFLILTGSSVGMMEREVLNYKSPLYGRRTGQIKLEEMPIYSLKEFLPGYSFEEIVETYGVVGGIPLYLRKIDSDKNLMENISETFLNKANLLHEEAEILLREELRKPNVYFNILKTILDGATKLSEISSQSRVDITNINKYLKVLERLKVIRKEYPITEPAKKKNFRYHIQDNYIRFWLNFVYPYQSDIEENKAGVLDTVKKEFNEYLGPFFEDISKKAIRKFSNYPKVGKWWYKDNEIDLVALNENKKQILFGECKWSKNKVGKKILDNLEKTAKKVRWTPEDRQEKFALFSKSGFNSKLKNLEKEGENLELYDLNRIERLFESSL